jgi:hypothetical protein
VCHETAGFFGFFRSKGNSIPSEHPRQRRTLFPFEIPMRTETFNCANYQKAFTGKL